MAKKENLGSTDDGIITTAAKKLGKAAGKVAAAVGATDNSGTEASPVKQPSNKVPKLEKKNKKRLPRREKKARRKAGGI